jgi:FAD-dependent urate hydroxylase
MHHGGFLGHFAALPDLDRWRFMRHIFDLNQPPPQDTFWRCRRHSNFTLRLGCPWKGAHMEGEEIVIETPSEALRFDYLVIGTGFAIDLSLRPELSHFASRIALWRDRFTPPPAEENTLVSSYPYLGDSFQFLEREPDSAPGLSNLYNFTFGAMPSMGLSGGSISGLRYGVPRLVSGIARDLFVADKDRHLASLPAYRTPELATLELPLEEAGGLMTRSGN